MTTYRSDQWSNAHLNVNDILTNLLNALRDLGYNPSLHISYDKAEHHLLLDTEILDKHANIATLYDNYLSACNQRDAAVDEIQKLPKLDLGF